MKVERGTGNGEGGERNAEGGARNAEWVTVKLGDVVDINPRRNSFGFTDDETVGFVPMSSVCEQKKAIVDQQVRPFGEVKKGYTPMQNGDVIIAKITPCFENGKVARVELPTSTAFGSTEFHVFRNRGTVDSDLVFHLLRSEQILRKGREQMKGAAGQKRVPADFFRAFEFRVPRSLPEQQRIARILDRADLLRQSRRAALAQLDAFLQATFLDMFGDPVTNPKGWEVVKSAKLFSEKPRIGTTRPAGGSGFPVVRVGEVGDSQIRFEDCGRVELSETEFTRFNLKLGDTVIARAIGSANQLGKASYFAGHPEPVVFDSHVMRLRPSQSICHPKWLFSLISSQHGKRLIQMKGGATAVQFNINTKQASDLDIPIPPLDLQRRFAAIVESVEAQKARMQAHLADLDLLFASLQDRAFKGEL
ncbi:MAG: restriction endonuclease subunit S [Opitutales bacterium]|nr:restriction endonuclease subunit S [Opitutales bacterium]